MAEGHELPSLPKYENLGVDIVYVDIVIKLLKEQAYPIYELVFDGLSSLGMQGIEKRLVGKPNSL